MRILGRESKSLPSAYGRVGMTLVELLVAMSIIAILVALLLPATQAVREQARSLGCSNNLRKLHLGLDDYHSSRNRYPTGGRETTVKRSRFDVEFSKHSTHSALLPHIGQLPPSYPHMDLKSEYWGGENNVAASKVAFSVFLCPSSTSSGVDDDGFGVTHYSPIVGTSIDPVSGQPNLARNAEGGMTFKGMRQEAFSDGRRFTLLFAEDDGRNDSMIYPYLGTRNPRRRSFWRWAEPANALHLAKGINNNSSPRTGPAACRWDTIDCGPFEEVFSSHVDIAKFMFADGHVIDAASSMSPVVLRALVTSNGGDGTTLVNSPEWESLQ